MQFRLTFVAGVIFLTACAAGAEPDAALEESATATSASPFVGTWRWSGSGTRFGTIELGEEHYIFHADGTYTVVSKSGDGIVECYEGTFAWRPSATAKSNGTAHGTMVFNARYESEAYLDDEETLHFAGAGSYRKASVAIATRCSTTAR